MASAAMARKENTNGGKTVSDYTMVVTYFKPQWKCPSNPKLVSKWTYRGDTYLKVFQDQNDPCVSDQFEALVRQMSVENELYRHVTIYNNLLTNEDQQNVLYVRNEAGEVKPGKALNGFQKNSLKKFHLI